MIARSEAAILSRIIEPNKAELPASVARLVLKWKFSQADRRRMQDLLEKAKVGTITAEERWEAESYERVGHFISLLKAKAKVSLDSRSRPT